MQLNTLIASYCQCIVVALHVHSAGNLPQYTLTVHVSNGEARCHLETEPKGYVLMKGEELDNVFDIFKCQNADVLACTFKYIIPHMSRLLRDQNPGSGDGLEKLCMALETAAWEGIMSAAAKAEAPRCNPRLN